MDTKEETLASHLQALRLTLIRCLIALAIFFVPAFFLSPYIIDFLAGSLELHYFHPMELFILQIKVAFVLSLLVAFPYIARQVWVFILPALYENERKFIRSIVFFSSTLFIGGVLFCLFVCFPMVVNFGINFSNSQSSDFFNLFAPNDFSKVIPTIGVTQVVSLALWLSIAFGVMFQFPLITYGLIQSGIASYESIQNKRPYVLVGILIIAAILTPPDVVSQLVLAIPTYALFELGLLFSRRYKRK